MDVMTSLCYRIVTSLTLLSGVSWLNKLCTYFANCEQEMEASLGLWERVKSILTNPSVTPWLSSVLCSLLPVSLTAFFALKQMKKQMKIDHQTNIYKQKIDALLAVQKYEKKALQYDLCLDGLEAGELSMNIHNLCPSYPSFMSGYETLKDFGILTSEMRHYETFLDYKSAAYLYVIERYLLNLSAILSENKCPESDLRIVGMVVIVDIYKWASEFDKVLVERINHPEYKLFSQSSKRWEREKKHVEKRYLINTQLNNYITTYKGCNEKN